MTNHFETLYCTYIYLGHPINCKVGSWENWSPCSKTCGIGESKRTRTIVRKAKRGGKDCPPLVGMRWCGSARNCHGAYFDWWIWITKNITVKPTLTFKYCTSNPRKNTARILSLKLKGCERRKLLLRFLHLVPKWPLVGDLYYFWVFPTVLYLNRSVRVFNIQVNHGLLQKLFGLFSQ